MEVLVSPNYCLVSYKDTVCLMSSEGSYPFPGTRIVGVCVKFSPTKGRVKQPRESKK